MNMNTKTQWIQRPGVLAGVMLTAALAAFSAAAAEQTLTLKMARDFDSVADAVTSAASSVGTTQAELAVLSGELDELRGDVERAKKQKNALEIARSEALYAQKQSEVRGQANELTKELLTKITEAKQGAERSVARHLGPVARGKDLADALAGRGLAGGLLKAMKKLEQFEELASRAQVEVLVGDLNSGIAALGHALRVAKKAADGSTPEEDAEVAFGETEPDDFEVIVSVGAAH